MSVENRFGPDPETSDSGRRNFTALVKAVQDLVAAIKGLQRQLPQTSSGGQTRVNRRQSTTKKT